jgi:hypothetical protein
MPEWSLDSGHAHPDAGSFIIWAHGRYLTGDTGYAGLPTARNHNTVTFGGVGQGVEGDHDVWRGAPYASFDGIRIRSVKADGPGVAIEADLAAAYPKVTGLSAFTRTFTFDGKTVFKISDRFTLKDAAPIEWRIQSDTPFESASAGAFRNGEKGASSIEVVITGPKDAEVARAVGKLKVPGPPGSITTGAEEDRGHVLTATIKAPAGESRIEAALSVVK